MKEVFKIDNPFHERVVKAFGLFSHSFFDMHNVPCEFSNGFTIFTTTLVVEKEGYNGFTHRQIYFVRPNRSPRWFCFSSLLSAVGFCNSHSNKHPESYWLKRYMLIYSYDSVCNFIMSLLNPDLYYTPISLDDDLPF